MVLYLQKDLRFAYRNEQEEAWATVNTGRVLWNRILSCGSGYGRIWPITQLVDRGRDRSMHMHMCVLCTSIHLSYAERSFRHFAGTTTTSETCMNYYRIGVMLTIFPDIAWSFCWNVCVFLITELIVPVSWWVPKEYSKVCIRAVSAIFQCPPAS